MRITEDLMLCKKLFGAPVYEASVEGTLRNILCTKKGFLRSIQGVNAFSDGHNSPWWLYDPKKVIYKEDTPAKHKVFTEEEVEFLLAYDELGDLSLDTLMYLADPHRRCTFNVSPDNFIKFFSEMPELAKQFKYNSNLYNISNNITNLKSNYMLAVSFYKIDTFMYNVYTKDIEGVGISFEIMNEQKSVEMPKVECGYYVLLTDQYDGVFYLDGREISYIQPTAFADKLDFFKEVINICKSPRKKSLPPKEPSFRYSDHIDLAAANFFDDEEEKEKIEEAVWEEYNLVDEVVPQAAPAEPYIRKPYAEAVKKKPMKKMSSHTFRTKAKAYDPTVNDYRAKPRAAPKKGNSQVIAAGYGRGHSKMYGQIEQEVASHIGEKKAQELMGALTKKHVLQRKAAKKVSTKTKLFDESIPVSTTTATSAMSATSAAGVYWDTEALHQYKTTF